MALAESTKMRRTQAGEGEWEEAERRRAGSAFVAAVEAALEAVKHARGRRPRKECGWANREETNKALFILARNGPERGLIRPY